MSDTDSEGTSPGTERVLSDSTTGALKILEEEE